MPSCGHILDTCRLETPFLERCKGDRWRLSVLVNTAILTSTLVSTPLAAGVESLSTVKMTAVGSGQGGIRSSSTSDTITITRRLALLVSLPCTSFCGALIVNACHQTDPKGTHMTKFSHEGRVCLFGLQDMSSRVRHFAQFVRM